MTLAPAPPAFALPAALLSEGFALRRESERDLPFLMALFASTRANELAVVPWSEDQKRTFVAQQFEAQRRHYRAYHPTCAFDIIERNGVPAGRLYLEARATALHIIDIALLPEWRGRGVGTAILTASQAEAHARGLAVSLLVEKFNPALRLYRRLGFADAADHGVYLEMEWPGRA